MAASKKTVDEIVDVIGHYLHPDSLTIAMLDKLCKVKGNKSFAITMQMVRDRYIDRYRP